MNNYCAFSKNHQCIKRQDCVSARLELEECDELCHGNWIEIESLQRHADFLKKLLEENSIVSPDDYYTYDLLSVSIYSLLIILI